MKGTLTLPCGATVRTQSTRRYALVKVDDGRATVVARSDSSGKIRARRTASQRVYRVVDGQLPSHLPTYYVVDTEAREVLP